MKKIESNEENLAIKKKKQLRNHPILWGIGAFVLLSSFSFLTIVGGWEILLFAGSALKWTKTIKIVSAVALMLGWGGGTTFFTVKVLNNMINSITRKNTQQSHSDFDTDKNHQQVEKEEKKKYQQPKGLENIEKQDKKYLLALPPNAEEMTAEEIAALLNQEIDFWNQVEFQKNLGDIKEKIKVKKGAEWK